MIHKRNVEQLESKMKLLVLNFEEFKLQKMVHMYAYIYNVCVVLLAHTFMYVYQDICMYVYTSVSHHKLHTT